MAEKVSCHRLRWEFRQRLEFLKQRILLRATQHCHREVTTEWRERAGVRDETSDYGAPSSGWPILPG